MKNDKTPLWERFESGVDSMGMTAWGVLLLSWLLGLTRRDEELVDVATWLWLGHYVLVSPWMVWRIAAQTPGQKPWRAAAILALGLLPWAAFVIPDSPLRAWPALAFASPLLVAWSTAAQLLAQRENAPDWPPRRRALAFAGAAVVSALLAVPLLAAAVLFAVMAVWAPPPGAILFGPVIALLCLPFGLGFAYGALRLVREARHAWRERHLAAAAS